MIALLFVVIVTPVWCWRDNGRGEEASGARQALWWATKGRGNDGTGTTAAEGGGGEKHDNNNIMMMNNEVKVSSTRSDVRGYLVVVAGSRR